MNFHMDNLGYLLLGCLIGYLVRVLQDIKKKVDEVDDIVKGEKPRLKARDERGRAWRKLVPVIAVPLVVFMTAFAAFSSQKASNDLERVVAEQAKTQAQLEGVVNCIQTTLITALESLNERSDSNVDASRANAELQKSWYRFVRFQLHIPPFPEAQQRNRANIYAEKLHEFVKAFGDSQIAQALNSYPQGEQLKNCINYQKETK